ncbi:MAG: hypothetical protein GF364_09450, partial [Candidatus Lokiarchaeota archaeon]|nr:hypothetical protein [Candidatus Lokiarchaeota archaeon]
QNELMPLVQQVFSDLKEELHSIKSNVKDLKDLMQLSFENLDQSFKSYNLQLDKKIRGSQQLLLTKITEKSDIILKNIIDTMTSNVTQLLGKLDNIEKKVDIVHETVEKHEEYSNERFIILVEKITELKYEMETIKMSQEQQSEKVKMEYKEIYRKKMAFKVQWPEVDNSLSKKLRNIMIKQILRDPKHRKIINEKVLETMSIVPRHIYANLDLMYRNAYRYTGLESEILKDLYQPNQAIPITKNQSSSAPEVIAIMLSLFNINPGDKILFVGAKGGYIQSIAAEMVGSEGKIISISSESSAIERNEKICGNKTPYSKIMTWIYVRDIFEVTRLLNYAPFNSIFVCGRLSDIPEEYLALLSEGGSLVAPIGSNRTQKFSVIRRKEDSFKNTTITNFNFIFGPPV